MAREDEERRLVEQLANTPWKPVWDPSSESHYFWNTETNATSWDLPAISSQPPPTPAPPQQQQPQHNQSGAAALNNLPQQQQQPSYDYFSGGYAYDYSGTFGAGSADPHAQALAAASASASSGTIPGSNVPIVDPSLYHQAASGQYADYRVGGFFNEKTNRFESKPEEKNPTTQGGSAKAMRQMHHYFDYNAWVEVRLTSFCLSQQFIYTRIVSVVIICNCSAICYI
jgi:hypothetical protein